VTFAFEDRPAFNADCFHHFIESLPIDIYRVKDFALLEDKRFFLNHVGGKTEWVELDEVGPTKLAFVGWQVNEKETLRALKVCLKL
jgi:G3E family GTPase